MKILPLKFGRYRFEPALWPSVAFALVFPVLLGLGYWQTDRAGAKQDLVEQRAATEIAAPLTLDGHMPLGDADRYRPAEVRGRYLAEQQWLLDNRVYRGQPGYHVFTPFVVEGDEKPALLVNRGWVAVGASRDYLPALPVPENQVTLYGRLDSPASVGLVVGEVPLESVADKVVVQSLDIAALGAVRGMDLLRYALVIDDGQAGGLQYDWSPIPEMGPEKHLGYAVQWFGLAVALLIIFVGVNTRRDGGDGETRVEAR
jgi:surfeit locus 1 family protein